jgi:hypothetical protein
MVMRQLHSSVACTAREVGRAEEPSLERDRGRENVENGRNDFASQIGVVGVVVGAAVGCTLGQSCEGMESLFERGATVGSRRSNQSGASFVVGCWLWEEAAAAVIVHMKPWNYVTSLSSLVKAPEVVEEEGTMTECKKDLET